MGVEADGDDRGKGATGTGRARRGQRRGGATGPDERRNAAGKRGARGEGIPVIAELRQPGLVPEVKRHTDVLLQGGAVHLRCLGDVLHRHTARGVEEDFILTAPGGCLTCGNISDLFDAFLLQRATTHQVVPVRADDP